MLMGAVAGRRRSGGAGSPINTTLPFIADVDGAAITVAYVGQDWFYNPGGWSPLPDSYNGKLTLDGTLIPGTDVPMALGDLIYTVDISDEGKVPVVGAQAVVGGSPVGSFALSTALSAIIRPAPAAPVAARTSSSGAAFVFTLTIDSSIFAGFMWHLTVRDNDTGELLQDLYKPVTQDEIDAGGSHISYWNGTYFPYPTNAIGDTQTLVTPTGTQEVQAEIYVVVPGLEHPISSDFSNTIMPTDVSYGPELLTNPDFDSGSTGWDVHGHTVVAGELILGPFTGAVCDQPFTYTLGATYRVVVQYEKTGDTDSSRIRVCAGGPQSDTDQMSRTSPLVGTVSGTFAFNWVATRTTGYFSVEADSSSLSGKIKRCSLKEVL